MKVYVNTIEYDEINLIKVSFEKQTKCKSEHTVLMSNLSLHQKFS